MAATDEVARARERWAEQLMSDERLLGALPEDATRLVLDHALARLDAAAATAASEEELAATFATIRQDARALVDRAAATDDPDAVVRTALVDGLPGPLRGGSPALGSAPKPRHPSPRRGEAGGEVGRAGRRKPGPKAHR